MRGIKTKEMVDSRPRYIVKHVKRTQAGDKSSSVAARRCTGAVAAEVALVDLQNPLDLLRLGPSRKEECILSAVYSKDVRAAFGGERSV